VVHGAVDGYSRMPMYLHCSSNNRASTVLHLFQEAISNYGLPSRIRIDQGGENVDISLFLLMHPLRGPGRGSVIVGRSVHNQRIERMWRDVYEGILHFYHGLFCHLESVDRLSGQLRHDSMWMLLCISLHILFVVLEEAQLLLVKVCTIIFYE